MRIDADVFKAIIKGHKGQSGKLDESIKGMFDVNVECVPGQFKVALIHCVPYFVGAGMMGTHIIHNVLANIDDVCVDYCYLPEPSIRKSLKKNKIPLFGYGTKIPLREFDVLGFSMFYAPNVCNMVQIINYAGIPFLASERGENHPIIISGGVVNVSPEGIAPIFDIMFIGEGEEQVPTIIHTIKGMKASGVSKDDILKHIARRIPGCYVPKFYENVFDEKTKRYAGMRKLDEHVPDQIQWQKVDISNPKYNYTITNYQKNIARGKLYLTKDVEVTRGCVHGCRFCSPFSWYKPYRERNFDGIIESIAARKELGSVRMMGLTPTDYSRYNEVRDYAIAQGMKYDGYSERVDQFERTWNEGRSKKSVCFALECPNERMRRVVNKHLSDDVFWSAFKLAIKSGITKTKVMCMMGVPFETKEDVLALHELLDKMWTVSREIRPESCIELSVNMFTPKPHTPFQWAPYRESLYMGEFIKVFNDRFNDNAYRMVDPKTQMSVVRGSCNIHGSPTGRRLEALLDRSDRRFCVPMIKSILKFNVFSQQDWGDSSKNLWNGVKTYMMAQYGYDIEDTLRELKKEDPLPWDIISVGTDKEFLWQEWERAEKAEESYACTAGCNQCGIQKDKFMFEKGVCSNKKKWFNK